jgi:hypothetical protein
MVERFYRRENILQDPPGLVPTVGVYVYCSTGTNFYCFRKTVNSDTNRAKE